MSLTVEDGMLTLEEAFSKTRKIMEGCSDVRFTAAEYQRFYECVYVLCVQRTSSENSKILYDRYQYGLEECIISWVLPALETKDDMFLLSELVVQWNNYSVVAKWLSRFFSYLDRFYIPRVGAPGLLELSIRSFHSLVNARFSSRFITAFTSMINRDRNGETHNRYLLKNITEYFFQAQGTVGRKNYEDFQNALLSDAATYYSRFASNGLQYDSSADYMNKAQQFLNQEEERADHVLDPSSKEKLLQGDEVAYTWSSYSAMSERICGTRLYQNSPRSNEQRTMVPQQIIRTCCQNVLDLILKIRLWTQVGGLLSSLLF